MLLLVGLGNPGAEYAGNRHNIGFMVVDEIARRHGFGPWRKRFHGRSAEGTVAGDKVLALEPLTYMNLSGQAAAAALAFHKLAPERMVVFHDEIDLAPGKVRVKKGGGAGGHNGLRSLDQHLGPEYWRVRLGVGHPGHRDLVHDYVLHDFAKADGAWLALLIEACASAFPLLVEGHPEKFASRVALLTQPPKPEPTPG
ncbi:MAG: aminoacyl-tRNA hydrolase [Azospirillum sp.]|nr:aminoacyl-tRNA hydrolase [Azospirillum sp.]